MKTDNIKSAPHRSPQIYLRAVERSDLPVFYEHQLDPEATQMAAFPARDEATFTAHWNNILRDESSLVRTIIFSDQVAGNIGSWGERTNRNVGYWIGREYWNRGIATRALEDYLAIETLRPLYAHVAKHNFASLRVLQKCGFKISREDIATDDGAEELVLALLR